MMPTRPLQVAFWSLLVGFVATLALALPRIDTKPMAIIAGQQPRGAAELAIASSATKPAAGDSRFDDRSRTESSYDELPPPPNNADFFAVSRPAPQTPSMTVANTSHRPHAAESADDDIPHSEPAPSPEEPRDEPLVEIGTIVVPSLTANRNQTHRSVAEFPSEQFAVRDRQIAELERRLDRLQDKMDGLLTSQVEHQTAELESLARLVEQLQNDRDLLRMRQQIDELHRERHEVAAEPEATDAAIDATVETESLAEPPSTEPRREGWTEVAPQPRTAEIPPVQRDDLPIVVPDVRIETELVVPVPDPHEIDLDSLEVESIPFPLNADELPDFKLPPNSRQPRRPITPPSIEFAPTSDKEIPRDTSERDYTIPPEFPPGGASTRQQSASPEARTVIIPQQPSRAADEVDQSPPEKITVQAASTPRTAEPLAIDVVVLNVTFPSVRGTGIDWSRLRDESGRPVVDFASSALRNAREPGLAIGTLGTDIHTLQRMLRSAADVEVTSRQALNVAGELPSFVDLASATEGGESGDGLRLKIQSADVVDDRTRLLVSLIDSASESPESITGDALVTDGESLVIGGMIFEEIVETEVDDRRFNLPFLGRKKPERQQSRIQTEQVIVLTIKSAAPRPGPTAEVPEPGVSQRTSPSPKPDSHVIPVTYSDERDEPSRRIERLAERQYHVAHEFFERGLIRSAHRHIQLALELNPNDTRMQQLADRIAAKLDE